MRIAILALCLIGLTASARAASGDAAFDAFIASTRAPAQAAGVSRTTFERETAGLKPDPGIKAKPARQGEFSLPIHSYLAQVVTGARVSAGRAEAREMSDVLSTIQRRFGAPWEICVAIWGIETNFGASQGNHDILRSIATLAVRNHRADFYRDEFVAGLVMLQHGTPRAKLVGSWAGAMGEPQFTPSSYLKYAVKFSGQGAPDIWRSSADSLASIANFLRQSGWKPGLPAAMEIVVPENFDWKPVDLDLSQWRALGFRRADGEALPASGAAGLFLPEGAGGPAFLITDNWEVIRQYNTSDAYALAVSLLADRIAGSAGLQRAWPKTYVNLSLTTRAQAQKLLEAKGLYSGATDGKIGRATRMAVHAFQIREGILPADGLLKPEVYKRLGGKIAKPQGGKVEKLMKFVAIERNIGPEGRIAVVRFDRGDRLNALSGEAMRELRAAAQSFEDDPNTSVVVLTGNAHGFSAGFDLKDAEGRERPKLGLGDRRAALMAGPRMCRAWYDMEQVTICAIEGHCIGGGAALAVSLDFRFCGASAHFRIPEVELGMNMSWGSVPRMLQLMGPARTKQAVILASDRISAPEAERWGLVEYVVEDGEAFAAAYAFAERIAAQPPIPTMMTKTTVNRLSGALDDLASHMDRDQFALTNLSEDHAEGVAAFLERRKPRFRGR